MKKSVKNAIVIAVVVLIALLWHSMIKPWEWQQKMMKTEKPGFLWSVEQQIEDLLYRRPEGTSNNIKIIGIDEKTLDAYGEFEDWSREKLADLIEVLSADESRAPRVIALDFLLISNSEGKAEEEARLAEAAKKAGNVVLASNLVYRTAFGTDETGNTYYDKWNISMIERPYEQLDSVVTVGFTNSFPDVDGFIRRVKLMDSQREETNYSFAYQIYRKNLEAQGKQPADFDSTIQFCYSGAPGDYEMVSLVDVLDGKQSEDIIKAYKNCIILVGAYAPGMQDSFHVAVDHGEQMYGVEVHANIVDSLLKNKIVKDVPITVSAIITVLVLAVYAFAAMRQKKLLPVLLEGFGVIVAWLAAGIVLKNMMWLLPVSVVTIGTALLMIYFVITKYVLERVEKKRVLKAFERYVAPEIVKELGKDESFESRLGGERRDIAVLFVDIRGFTTMSESLQPEQVVDILNEYLELTSSSIFNNQGTLDKFIGDATMAVFNAPMDLDDYVFKAVCAAYDMRKGAEILEKKLTEQFGNSVQFGIGVNCGPAIVGNIGSVKRMDYTAIGDTVNTAARLESNAKRGEILISEAVYERIKDRIEAEPVGELSLKGKATKILTYRLIDIK